MSEGVQRSQPVLVLYTVQGDEHIQNLLDKAQMSVGEWMELNNIGPVGASFERGDRYFFFDPKSTCERDRNNHIASLMEAGRHSPELREQIIKNYKCDRLSSFWQDATRSHGLRVNRYALPRITEEKR